MAIQQFIAPDQCTIWDIVLNTYGTVDQLLKLMQDNLWPNVNTYPEAGDIFNFDDTLVENQNNLQSNLAGVRFATRQRTTTNETVMSTFESTQEAEYTSNADGTVTIPLPSLIGSRMLWLEIEIKPVSKANYSWNATSGILTLLNGVTLDNGQTAYIQYVNTVTQ